MILAEQDTFLQLVTYSNKDNYEEACKIASKMTSKEFNYEVS